MNLLKNRQIIGTTEIIGFPEIDLLNLPAKIDTGAYRSSVWASSIKETDKGLSFKLFDKESPYYNGEKVVTKLFEKSKVRNSFGHQQERYRIKLKIMVGNKTYKTDFTLADRSINKYPILLGRELLRGRFVVDVTKKNVHFKQTKAKLIKKV